MVGLCLFQRENGCSFELDFSKVYWNSRLSTEHERIVGMLNPNDVLCEFSCLLVYL